MVWGVISKKGRLLLFSSIKGSKSTLNTIKKEFLEKHLLPGTCMEPTIIASSKTESIAARNDCGTE
jgi:hypothetical protein